MEIVAVAADGRLPGAQARAVTSPRWESRSDPGLVVAHTTQALGSGERVDFVVRNQGRAPIALDQVRIRLDAYPSTVLEHGYQSWSPVAATGVAHIRPWRRHPPGWPRATWFAAPSLAGRAVMGDQFLVLADGCGRRGRRTDGTGAGGVGGVVGFLDGTRHLSTAVAGPDGLWAAAWFDGIVLEASEERALDPMWLAEGHAGRLYSEYAHHWGQVAGARTTARRPVGWCSWYQYFWKVTPDDVRRNLREADRRGIDMFQIDDGYAEAVGDWLSPAPSWSQGDLARGGQIGALAAEIAATGATAGIWTAPFLAGARSAVARAHPAWLVQRPGRRGAKGHLGAGDLVTSGSPGVGDFSERDGEQGHSQPGPASTDGRGKPLGAIWNPVSWGGWVHPLDTSRPEVLDHLRETYSRLGDLGYRYHKIDFCYAASLPGRRFADGKMTRAQVLRAGLEAVREGIGDDAYLLGCGCPLAQAVGVVDAMRVSPDTAPYWLPLMSVPGYPDTGPAARNAVRASVLRAPLHRRLWVNDPDCLLLRPSATHLSPEKRDIVTDVVAATGGLAVISDDLTTYTQREWDTVAGLRGGIVANDPDDPVDIDDLFSTSPAILTAGRRLDVRLGRTKASALWSAQPPVT